MYACIVHIGELNSCIMQTSCCESNLKGSEDGICLTVLIKNGFKTLNFESSE